MPEKIKFQNEKSIDAIGQTICWRSERAKCASLHEKKSTREEYNEHYNRVSTLIMRRLAHFNRRNRYEHKKISKIQKSVFDFWHVESTLHNIKHMNRNMNNDQYMYSDHRPMYNDQFIPTEWRNKLIRILVLKIKSQNWKMIELDDIYNQGTYKNNLEFRRSIIVPINRKTLCARWLR